MRAKIQMKQSTCGLVAMTSASHAEGRQLESGQVYTFVICLNTKCNRSTKKKNLKRSEGLQFEPGLVMIAGKSEQIMVIFFSKTKMQQQS